MSWILAGPSAGDASSTSTSPTSRIPGIGRWSISTRSRRRLPRVPAFLLIVDAEGRALYPLSAPTWHDAEVAKKFGDATPARLDEAILNRPARSPALQTD